MAWDDEMITIIRGLLQDYPTPTDVDGVEDPPKYSDDRLSELLLIAAQNVTAQVTFTQTYVVNIPNLTLRPDPTNRGNASTASTRDDAFINLVTLKAACLIATAEVREFTSQGISLRDVSSAISLQRSPASLQLMQKTYCQAYSDALYQFQTTGTLQNGGLMVLGPHGCGERWYNDYPYMGPPCRVSREW